tara:strand:+ start:729 stop:893 length:165 start_codon:yes stop_codon:yes gene_type:complete
MDFEVTFRLNKILKMYHDFRLINKDSSELESFKRWVIEKTNYKIKKKKYIIKQL